MALFVGHILQVCCNNGCLGLFSRYYHFYCVYNAYTVEVVVSGKQPKTDYASACDLK